MTSATQPRSCGRLGNGQDLFLIDGVVSIQIGEAYFPLRRPPLRYYTSIHGSVFGPLREGSLDGPLRASDFCLCPRGTVALAWFENGLTVLPALLEQLPFCGRCAEESGLVLYQGSYTDQGELVYFADRAPTGKW